MNTNSKLSDKQPFNNTIYFFQSMEGEENEKVPTKFARQSENKFKQLMKAPIICT